MNYNLDYSLSSISMNGIYDMMEKLS